MAPPRPAKKRASAAGWLRRTLPKNSPQRVAVAFVAILAVFLPFALFSGGWAGWKPITETIAAAGAAGARAVGIHAIATGNLIVLSTRSLSIDPQCTAVTLLAVYAALVLAYPLRWRDRLIALAVGAIVLQLANVGRLVGVAWASELLADKRFYIVHDYLFEFGMVFLVLLMWVVWLSIARRTA